jgi:adenine-specific DNA-methyltransferase
MKIISTQKSSGRFYTPPHIVQNILDLSGYYGKNILQKHVMDNSCGDGAFLTEIVARYCDAALAAGASKEAVAAQLGQYIHGIEIDQSECEKCKQNVSAVVKAKNIPAVRWDIRAANAMSVHEYDGKMDFVLGNPPYVRVHNAGDSLEAVKRYSFAKSGMTDFYLVFYEIGLQMLDEKGILGYITPSSFFNSLAGEYMRQYFVAHRLMEKIVDLKHYQPFGATTYTAIAILNKANRTDETLYYDYDEEQKQPRIKAKLSADEYYIGNKFYFSDRGELSLLKSIFGNTKHCNVAVKNGYATLCDDVFIGTFDFSSKYILPVVKASTGKKCRMIYPYDKKGNILSEGALRANGGGVYEYLSDRKLRLTKRSLAENTPWYAFGRSQAIGDTYREKLSLNSLLRSENDLKLVRAPSGTGVYGGLYLTGEREELKRAKEVLGSAEFMAYVRLLGKYKSGGYYAFSSKDVKIFLDHKLTASSVETVETVETVKDV